MSSISPSIKRSSSLVLFYKVNFHIQLLLNKT